MQERILVIVFSGTTLETERFVWQTLRWLLEMLHSPRTVLCSWIERSLHSLFINQCQSISL